MTLSPEEKWQRLWSGEETPPFVMAELSGNHGGRLETALALVDAAAEAGADAIKLQTYTADDMTLPLHSGEFVISDPNSLWFGRSLHELYAQASTPWDWHEVLFRRARSLGLMAFSSPFSPAAVEFLATLDVPAYKIASFELTDLPLIRAAARQGKPLILSTGMATLAEIDEAVTVARAHGAAGVALLRCTSRYPARIDQAHVRTIPNLRETFGVPVGFSDHTLGTAAAAAAVALGARLIEKHLVLALDREAVDAEFSADPVVFAALVRQCHEVWQSLGQVLYGGSDDDRSERRYRRSLYVARDLSAGDCLTPDNLRVIRPGAGLEPRYYDLLLGRRVAQDLPAGTPLAWQHVMPES